MKGLNFLKYFIVYILLIEIYTINYPRFKTCDPEWGDDKLWIDYVQMDREFTFCNDEERGEEANFLNGKLMTLLATGLNARNIICGEFGSCNPGKINKLIISLKFNQELFENTLRIETLKKYEEKIDVKSFLDNNYILISSHKFVDRWKFFLVTEVYDEGIKGIDHEGNDIILTSTSSLWGFAGWKVKNI